MALGEAYDTRPAKEAIRPVTTHTKVSLASSETVTRYRYFLANFDKGGEPTSGLEPLT